jgi:hypothetical protein
VPPRTRSAQARLPRRVDYGRCRGRTGSDPVESPSSSSAEATGSELASSKAWARPGGNLTGVSTDPDEHVASKRLQLFREMIPGLSRVMVLGSEQRKTRSASSWPGLKARAAACNSHIYATTSSESARRRSQEGACLSRGKAQEREPGSVSYAAVSRTSSSPSNS